MTDFYVLNNILSKSLTENDYDEFDSIKENSWLWLKHYLDEFNEVQDK